MVMGINSRLPSVGDLLKYADKALLNNQFFGDWDIYDSKTNQKIVSFDSFLGYDYSDDISIMNHPIENGSFANYNRVVDPASVNIMLAKSGFPYEIRGVIDILEQYKESTNLIDIVTPYKTYVKYNIKSIHYAVRESNAINLLVINLGLEEIREVELGYKTTEYGANKVSSGDYADTKDNGKKTTKDVPPSMAVKLVDGAKKFFRKENKWKS